MTFDSLAGLLDHLAGGEPGEASSAPTSGRLISGPRSRPGRRLRAARQAVSRLRPARDRATRGRLRATGGQRAVVCAPPGGQRAVDGQLATEKVPCMRA